MKWLRFPRVIGVVVAVYLVAVTVLFAQLSMENRSFLRTAESTEGTVVALVPRTFSGGQRPVTTHRDRGVPLAPEVRYTVGGVTYTYTPSHGRYKPNVKIGEHVTIIYDPDDPQQTARIKGEGRVVIPVITVGFALVALLVVVGLVLTRKRGIGPGPKEGAGPKGRADRPGDHGGPGPHGERGGAGGHGAHDRSRHPGAASPASPATPVRHDPGRHPSSVDH